MKISSAYRGNHDERYQILKALKAHPFAKTSDRQLVTVIIKIDFNNYYVTEGDGSRISLEGFLLKYDVFHPDVQTKVNKFSSSFVTK